MLEAPALIWECVRQQNSFIRRNPHVKGVKPLSAEKGNLSGLHSFKYSGLANRNVLNVSTKKTGMKETIVMTTSNKKTGKLLRPGRRRIETGLKKSAAKGKAKIDRMLSR